MTVDSHAVAGAEGLAGCRRQAPSAQDLQAEPGPEVRREGHRRRRALPQPARQRTGALGRREDADPGLDRTHPMLPLRPGQVARRTHDYKRHGTANLYAAFNVATGEVLGRITRRHRATEFRQLLAQIDRATAARAGVAPDRRQQQHAHDRSDTRLPRCPSPLSPALHADQRVMAQRRRDLVRPVGAARPQTRRLHQRERTAR